MNQDPKFKIKYTVSHEDLKSISSYFLGVPMIKQF